MQTNFNIRQHYTQSSYMVGLTALAILNLLLLLLCPTAPSQILALEEPTQTGVNDIETNHTTSDNDIDSSVSTPASSITTNSSNHSTSIPSFSDSSTDSIPSTSNTSASTANQTAPAGSSNSSNGISLEPASTNVNLEARNSTGISLEAVSSTKASSNIVYEPSTVSVALSANQITMDSDAGVTGNQTSYAGSETLTVSTSKNKGYAIYLSTAEGKSEMQNTNSSISTAITPVTPHTILSAFPANTWGYALTSSAITAETPYYPVPAAVDITSPILKEPAGSGANTSTPITKTYTLSFGTAIDNSLPAGQYRATVVVSVIANPEVIGQTLQDITYMQEMTPEVCSNTVDADGNTIPTTGTGVSLEGTVFQTTLIDKRDNKSYRVAKLKDGKCWMTENLALNLLSSKTLTAGDSDLGHVTKLGDQTYNGDYTWTPKDTLTSVTNNYDSNGIESWHPNAYWYYQFNTATAGTGNTAYTPNGGDNAQGSICPKGWRLPVNGEYGALVQTAYGASGNDSVLVQQPLNFVHGGRIVGNLFYDGVDGNYWSATVSTYSVTDAYNLYFGPSYLDPSNGHGRGGGFSIRCLAR